MYHQFFFLLGLGVRPWVRVTRGVVVGVNLVRRHVVQLSDSQRYGLLHHHRSQLIIATAGLVVGIADGMAKFVVEQILAVIAKIAFKRNSTAYPASFIH